MKRDFGKNHRPEPAPALGCDARAADIRRALRRWYSRAARDLPWRATRDPYAIMVSEFMLQQTQVAAVVPYFGRWMRRFPSVTALASAEEEDVLNLWQGLGYYSRARNLLRAAKAIAHDHRGNFPENAAALAKLPGIGDYTAAAIASFAFDEPVPALDANVTRVLARLANIRLSVDSAPGKRALREQAEALLPKRGAGRINAALMELGARVCTARIPHCGQCPVRDFCRAETPSRLPVKKPRPTTRDLTEDCAWAFRSGHVLLERQTGPRWRGLWKLPSIVSLGQGTNPPSTRPIHRATYPFTNHRVRLRIFLATAPSSPPANCRWIPVDAIGNTPMASAHARAIAAITSRP